MTPIQQGRLSQRKPIDPAAYDLYLRGRHAWNLRTDAGLKAAATDFEQAIEKAPDFALAYARLADVHVLSNFGDGSVAVARARALAAANRALELDDALAEAHTSRAALYFFQERDPVSAEREFQRALALNRGYPTAHQWYAILLSEAGRDAKRGSTRTRRLRSIRSPARCTKRWASSITTGGTTSTRSPRSSAQSSSRLSGRPRTAVCRDRGRRARHSPVGATPRGRVRARRLRSIRCSTGCAKTRDSPRLPVAAADCWPPAKTAAAGV